MTYIPIHAPFSNEDTRLAEVIRFFRGKNATESNKAIFLSKLDWGEVGIFSGPENKNWSRFKDFIKETDDNKFWLDFEAILEFRKTQKAKIKRTYFFFGYLMLFCGLFGFFILWLSPEIESVANFIFSGSLLIFGVGFFYLGNLLADKMYG